MYRVTVSGPLTFAVPQLGAAALLPNQVETGITTKIVHVVRNEYAVHSQHVDQRGTWKCNAFVELNQDTGCWEVSQDALISGWIAIRSYASDELREALQCAVRISAKFLQD